MKRSGRIAVIATMTIGVAALAVVSRCRFSGIVPEPVEVESVTRRAELIFIGDVMEHMPQVSAAKTVDGYDFSSQFADLKPIFTAADAVIANLETTLTDTPPYGGFPRFATPAELARDMAEAGIRYVNLANNHICDRRGKGVRSTLAALESEGIDHIGLNVDSLVGHNPYYLTIDGFCFALLGYTFSTNGLPVPKGISLSRLDTAQMGRDIRAIDRSATDYIIVMPHWGVEYSTSPSRRQRALAEWFLNQGVDFVIGSHPHVVQPFEVRCDSIGSVGSAVVYSMGNYVSNQNDPNTDFGLMVRLSFEQTDSLPTMVTFRADTVRRIRGKDYRVVSDSKSFL